MQIKGCDASLLGLLQVVINLEEGDLTKVVLARQTNITYSGELDPLQILQTLQARLLAFTVPLKPDQFAKRMLDTFLYLKWSILTRELFDIMLASLLIKKLDFLVSQFFIESSSMQDRDPRAFQLMLQTPEGATFLGSTPELLYRRCGSRVASEAVAATRPRGPPGEKSRTNTGNFRCTA